jgi:hypothetical protein
MPSVACKDGVSTFRSCDESTWLFGMADVLLTPKTTGATMELGKLECVLDQFGVMGACGYVDNNADADD